MTLLIDTGADLLDGLTQGLNSGFDLLYIFAFRRFLNLGAFRLDLSLDLRRDLVAQVAQRLLTRIDGVISIVASFDQFLALAVFFSMRLGILAHLFDFSFVQTRRRGNRNML